VRWVLPEAAGLILAVGFTGGLADRLPPPRIAPPLPAPVRAPLPHRPAVDRVLARMAWVARGGTARREVALTFDDGPGPFTAPVIDALQRLHAPATFFTLRGPRDYGGRFAGGDHSRTHARLDRLPAARQREEIGRARLFRPPYGTFDKATLRILRHRHELMVLWDVDSEDYAGLGAQAIAARVVRLARPGSIVLLHDGGGDRSQTLAAIPAIVRGLRARHLRPVTVPRLLRDAPPPRHQVKPWPPRPEAPAR
jgi:peptidoglycan/xylan/chitin deacetylase (PgdA/CDA1 family)